VSTIKYGLKENVQRRTITGTLDEEGVLQAKASTNYKAIQQDNLSSMIDNLSAEKVREALNEELGISSYQVNNFSYNQKKGVLPEIDEELDLTVNAFATVSGKRMFITPNLLNKTSTRLTEAKERKYPLEFKMEYKDIDSVVINVPDGYTVESITPEVKLATRFGTYNASVTFEHNKLTYIRTREQFAGKYPAKDYSELVQFLNAVYKADRNRVVLVKK